MKNHANIDIRIVGTSQDVKLLKKIMNYYLDRKASESEKSHVECYIGLIDYAAEKVAKGIMQ